ncbi:hypothetical protein CBS101457_003017 [Exobasidium rhododendri]|nr:hypothetical protein CBS101457_003017 [Exobasidium rhododendri]
MTTSYAPLLLATYLCFSVLTLALPTPMDGSGNWDYSEHQPSLHRVRTRGKSGPRIDNEAQTSRLDYALPSVYQYGSHTTRLPLYDHSSVAAPSESYTSRLGHYPPQDNTSYNQMYQQWNEADFMTPAPASLHTTTVPLMDYGQQHQQYEQGAYPSLPSHDRDPAFGYPSMPSDDTNPYMTLHERLQLSQSVPAGQGSSSQQPWQHEYLENYSLDHSDLLGSASSSAFGDQRYTDQHSFQQVEEDEEGNRGQQQANHQQEPMVDTLQASRIRAAKVLRERMGDLNQYAVSLGFEWKEKNLYELCWQNMPHDVRRHITKLVSKECNYKPQSLREKMAKTLMPLLAIAIQSGDHELFTAAINILYIRRGYDRVNYEWKTLLNEEQDEPEQLVHKLSQAAKRSPEDVRSFLCNKKIPAEVAHDLNFNSSEEQLKQFAMEHGLAKSLLRQMNKVSTVIHKEDKYYKPWKENTTKEDRNRIVKIVKKVLKCEESWANTVLERAQIEDGDEFGLEILRAVEEGGVDDNGIHAMLEEKVGAKLRRKERLKGSSVSRQR